jgi:hypothetical protein
VHADPAPHPGPHHPPGQQHVQGQFILRKPEKVGCHQGNVDRDEWHRGVLKERCRRRNGFQLREELDHEVNAVRNKMIYDTRYPFSYSLTFHHKIGRFLRAFHVDFRMRNNAAQSYQQSRTKSLIMNLRIT